MNFTPQHCPDPSTLADWIEGAVSDDVAETVMAHVSECETCNEWIERAEAEPRSLIAMLRDGIQTLAPHAGVDHPLRYMASLPQPLLTQDLPTHLGEFRIVRELGRGGMGVVYEAEQVALGRRVALKVLPPHSLQNDNRVKRFEREVQAAARLHHTNIVPVFGVGSDRDLHFYAMQYIQGRGLDQVIAETRARVFPRSPIHSANSLQDTVNTAPTISTAAMRLSRTRASEPDQTDLPSIDPRLQEAPSSEARQCDLPYQRFTADIGAQVASALHHAHAQGVEHRDIKPANLILDERGTVWVADFGLAKLDDGLELTGTGSLLGTFRFMAPETFQGHSDPRSDIYSLGITLYELLTLTPAFVSTNQRQLVHDITNRGPRSLTQVLNGVSRDLATIIHKAIAHDPKDRYHNAAELEHDLLSFVNDEPISARRPSISERLRRWGKRNRSLAGSFATLVALVLIGFFASTWAAIHFRRMEQSQRTLTTERQTAFEQAEASRLDALTNLKKAQIGESDMQTLLGLQATEQGDLGESLLWYAKAAMIGDEDPHRLWANSVRFRTTLRQVPQPVAVTDPKTRHTAEEFEFHCSLDFLACQSYRDRNHDFIWNLISNETLKLPPTIGNLYRSRWNSAGDVLAVANDSNQVYLLSFPGLAVLHQVDLPERCRHLKFTSDGKQLSIAAGPSAYLMSTSTPWSTIQCQPFDDDVLVCMFDPTNTKWVALSSDQFAVMDISDPSTTPSVSLLGRHRKLGFNGHLWPMFTTTNEIVTYEESNLSWHSLDTNEETRTMPLPLSPYCLAMAPQSNDIYSFAFSGSHQITADDTTLIGKAPYLAVAQIGTTDSFLTVGPRPTSRIWNSTNGKSRLGPIYNGRGSTSVNFSQDGKRLATTDHDGQIRVWTWPGETPTAEIIKLPRQSILEQQRFSPDGEHFLTTNQTTQMVEVFESSAGEPIGRSFRATGRVLDAQFLGDGSRIFTYSALTASSSLIEVWTWRDSIERVHAIEMPHPGKQSLIGQPTIRPDRTGDHLAIVFNDNTVGVLDLAADKLLSTSPLDTPKSIECFEYPDLLFVGCGFNNKRDKNALVRIDPVSGKEIFVCQPKSNAKDFAVAVKHRIIVAGTTKAIEFYDLETGSPLERPQIELPNWVMALTMSTDEDYLMVVTKDDLLRVIEMDSLEQVSQAIEVGPDPRCWMLANDRVIATYDDVGIVRFWDWRDGKPLGPAISVPTVLQHQNGGGHCFTVNGDQQRMLIGGIPESVLYDLSDFHEQVYAAPEFTQRWAELVSQRSIESGFASLSAREWFDRWSASSDIRKFFRNHSENQTTSQTQFLSFVLSGDIDSGVRFAEQSLKENPTQTPLRTRLATTLGDRAKDQAESIDRNRDASTAIHHLLVVLQQDPGNAVAMASANDLLDRFFPIDAEQIPDHLRSLAGLEFDDGYSKLITSLLISGRAAEVAGMMANSPLSASASPLTRSLLKAIANEEIGEEVTARETFDKAQKLFFVEQNPTLADEQLMLYALERVSDGSSDALENKVNARVRETAFKTIFDRNLNQLEMEDLMRLENLLTPLVPIGEDARVPWQYSFEPPPDDWIQMDFNDSTWSNGWMPLGTIGDHRRVRTVWSSTDVWLRKSFAADPTRFSHFKMRISHDDDVVVYLNGKQLFARRGVRPYEDLAQRFDSRLLQSGQNQLAVHVRNSTPNGKVSELERLGRGFIDLGLSMQLADEEIITLVDDAMTKYGDQPLLRVLRARSYANQQQWRPAADDLVALEPLSHGQFWPYFDAAPLVVLCDDEEFYRTYVSELKTHYRAEQLLQMRSIGGASLLRADACEDIQAIVKMAEAGCTPKGHPYPLPWGDLVLAMAKYRTGEYESAIDWCKATLNLGRHPQHGVALSIRTLALHQLGRQEEAQASLTELTKFMENRLKMHSFLLERFQLFDWYASIVWQREANAVLSP